MTDQAVSTVRELTHRPVVATRDGLRVLGGDDWPHGMNVTAAHVAAGELWGLVDRRDLYRFDGESPTLVASLESGEPGSCVGSHHGEIWVGGDEAGLWRLAGSSLEPVASFQDAPTRAEWYTPWGGPPTVFSTASHGDDFYVSVHVGGIMRTSDGGRTWSPTIDLGVDVHQVAVDEAGGVWAATGMKGLAHSTDRGDTWEYLTDGLHARYLLAVAVTAERVLVGASSGPAGRDGRVYRLAGDRFEPSVGLPDELDGAVSPRHLAALGGEAVVAVPGGDVFASIDGGRTWRPAAHRLRGISDVALLPGPG